MEKDGLIFRSHYFMPCAVAAGVVLLDQLSKALVVADIPPNSVIEIIPGFFNLVNIRNRGAAFGFLNRSDIEWQFWIFLVATLIAVWAIFALLRGAKRQPWLCLGLGLILGGSIGNMIDRLRFRAVVDFLDFYLGNWHWPAFNVADMAICVGAFLACLSVLRKPGLSKRA